MKSCFSLRSEMVKRLADPYDINRFVPRVDGLNKILATQIDGTGKGAQFRLGRFNDGREMSMPMYR